MIKVEIDPGICKFQTTVSVISEDNKNVEFEIETECELMKKFDSLLKEKTPLMALQELNPTESIVMGVARSLLMSKGCCEACVVPVAVCKAMYVTAGLALPADVSLKITKE